MPRWLLAIVMTLLPIAAAEATVPIALFGTAEFRADSLAALPKWRQVLERSAQEQPIYDACRKDPAACPNRGVMAWQALLQGLRGAPLPEQVSKVNRFVNQWRYRSDAANHGKSDYWASPLEFLARSGDCEDYAIAKYVSLRQLGVPAARLRLVVVQDELRQLAHAVLAVYLDDTAVILDNLTNAVLPHERVAHYAPYYSVNETARWAHVESSRLMLSAVDRSSTTAPASR
ncbi:MAG: transglutaminase-like cysteine peptidase [Geminicoccaceae bacterium]